MSKQIKYLAGITLFLCAALVYTVKICYDNSSNIESLNDKIATLSKQTSAVPKIISIDLVKVAQQWKDESDEQAIKAVDATINFYNERGYLIIDRASIVGGLGYYEGNVPTPEKMRQLMATEQK